MVEIESFEEKSEEALLEQAEPEINQAPYRFYPLSEKFNM